MPHNSAFNSPFSLLTIPPARISTLRNHLPLRSRQAQTFPYRLGLEVLPPPPMLTIGSSLTNTIGHSTIGVKW